MIMNFDKTKKNNKKTEQNKQLYFLIYLFDRIFSSIEWLIR